MAKEIRQLPEETTTTTSDKVPLQKNSNNVTSYATLANLLPAGSVTNAKLSTTAGEIGGASTTWTPTWTNVTVGNGTVTARYTKIGKNYICRIMFVFGSTSSTSGDIIFTLPATAVSYAGTANVTPIGFARAYDVSGSLVYNGTINMVSTTTVSIRFMLASGTYVTQFVNTGAAPVTWGNTDEYGIYFIFEGA